MLWMDADRRWEVIIQRLQWGKDREKDVDSMFWYPLFKGDRINDHHWSLAAKLAAQANKHETD